SANHSATDSPSVPPRTTIGVPSRASKYPAWRSTNTGAGISESGGGACSRGGIAQPASQVKPATTRQTRRVSWRMEFLAAEENRSKKKAGQEYSLARKVGATRTSEAAPPPRLHIRVRREIRQSTTTPPSFLRPLTRRRIQAVGGIAPVAKPAPSGHRRKLP